MADDGKRRGAALLLRRALLSISAVLLFAMMLLVTLDVAGRYLLNAPIAGSFEVTQFLLALLIFAALPVVTRDDTHISVSLVENLLKGRARFVQRLFVLLVDAVALGVIAWRTWIGGNQLAEGQQVTGYLEWPLAPLAYAMAILAGIAFLTVLAMIWTHLRGGGNAGPGRAPAGHPD